MLGQTYFPILLFHLSVGRTKKRWVGEEGKKAQKQLDCIPAENAKCGLANAIANNVNKAN